VTDRVAVPVPTARGEERVWFEAARERRLVHQRCDDCGAHVFYLRTVCPSCWSERLSLRDSSGRGVVHTFTTQHRPGHPAFADRVPYTVVLVDLEEGPRMLADLVGCPPEDVHVGLPVEVVFDDVSDDLTLPRFRPAAAR
jgi:uncharacterized OB-fold protein